MRRLNIVLRKIIYIILFITISGCTTLKLSQKPQTVFKYEPWQQRKSALSKIDHWKIDGAFSLHDSSQTIIAAYEWSQNGFENYWLNIHSSLNIESAKIVGRPGSVTLWRSFKSRYTAPNPEQLMSDQLGWELPISNLYFWIRGLPATHARFKATFDPYKHLIYLTQSGWKIKFMNYKTVGTVDLPQTLELDSLRFHIKIVIKHWSIST